LDSLAETHALISLIFMLSPSRNTSKSILVMNVHPSAVASPPGPTPPEPFAPEAMYEFRIDTNGDAAAE
jgi:hypothetical protein